MEKKSSSSSSSKQQSKNKSFSSSSPSSYSGSSSIAELFEDPSSSPSPSPSNSAGIFRSVFGPSSMGRGRNSSSHVGNVKHGNQSKNNYYEEERVEQPSCYYSSSLYYGAQEVYSPSGSTLPSDPHLTNQFKKDDQQHDDPNTASRGDWWQGSLYY